MDLFRVTANAQRFLLRYPGTNEKYPDEWVGKQRVKVDILERKINLWIDIALPQVTITYSSSMIA
jgi:hypothetical protein